MDIKIALTGNEVTKLVEESLEMELSIHTIIINGKETDIHAGDAISIELKGAVSP